MVFRMLLATALCLCGSGAAAQEAVRNPEAVKDVFDRGCGDDQGTDRCDPEVQQRMRDLYGVESAEALVASGITAYRAMFVDGYGRDIAIVSFVREPGVSPFVEVRTPKAEDGTTQAEPLRAPIGSEIWNDVIASAAYFDEKLAREVRPPEEDGTLRFCLHGWFVVAEAAVATRVDQSVLAGTGSMDADRDISLAVEAVMRESSIRSDAESSCAGGLAVGFAFGLADFAATALSQCDTFDGEDFRNLPVLLSACARASGDRLSTGDASRLATKLNRALRLERQDELEWLFVGLPEERARRFLTAIEGGDLYLNAPEGVDPDHARIAGQVIFRTEGGTNDWQARDITLNLLRQTGDFVIDTFDIGARRPYVSE